MPRLIEADKTIGLLKTRLYETALTHSQCREWDTALIYTECADNRIEAWIDEMPTVDAEPVVRCKDCKFFDHSDFGKGEECWCKHFVSTDDTAHCHKVSEDDFCAWGERKEDD